MALVTIAIPVYKSSPGRYEKISFERCIKILSRYPISIVTYKELDISFYTKRLLDAGIDFKVEFFDQPYFESLRGYNKLMLSSFFYERFKTYQYILLYQLDCYVFEDTLENWCSKGYDYIGAPWIVEDLYRWLRVRNAYPFTLRMFHRITRGKFLKRVGNGGLSLRRTSAMISNLRYFSLPAKKWIANEDIFFCHFVAVFNRFFKLPSPDIAVSFAFDIYPDQALELNNYQLPFGCHAFYRSDARDYAGSRTFWKHFIPELEKEYS